MSGTPVTAGCRMIKDAHELELMQIANDATLAGLSRGLSGDRAGHDAAAVRRAHPSRLRPRRLPRRRHRADRRVHRAAARLGAPQIIREGTIIMVDDGCTVEGYKSDITRTFVLGKASDEDEPGLRHRPPGAGRGA